MYRILLKLKLELNKNIKTITNTKIMNLTKTTP